MVSVMLLVTPTLLVTMYGLPASVQVVSVVMLPPTFVAWAGRRAKNRRENTEHPTANPDRIGKRRRAFIGTSARTNLRVYDLPLLQAKREERAGERRFLARKPRS